MYAAVVDGAFVADANVFADADVNDTNNVLDDTVDMMLVKLQMMNMTFLLNNIADSDDDEIVDDDAPIVSFFCFLF